MTQEVRRIRSDEGPKLRALRLSALADAPMAFGSTLSREEAFPEHVWQERAEGGASGADRATFIAERDGEWIGLATGLLKDPDDPNDTRPVLVGMFVAPSWRGRGVGAALVDAVVAWARERRAIGLCLWVTATNSPAIALYHKCGFRRTGEHNGGVAARPRRVQEGARAEESDPARRLVQLIVTDAPADIVGRSASEESTMNAETETAIQNLSKAFADTADFMSIMKRIATSLVNIELHLQAMRPSNMQTVRGPTR